MCAGPGMVHVTISPRHFSQAIVFFASTLQSKCILAVPLATIQKELRCRSDRIGTAADDGDISYLISCLCFPSHYFTPGWQAVIGGATNVTIVSADKDLAQLVTRRVNMLNIYTGERLGPDEVNAKAENTTSCIARVWTYAYVVPVPGDKFCRYL